MPKDEISNSRKPPAFSTDDADDEVVDLLEVVKPGRGLKRDIGRDEGDFSADLDAMLDGLSEGGSQPSGQDQYGNAVPFPDPTPVDHKVDHNETLDLPDMDDLDSLMKSFGASGNGKSQEEAEEPDFSAADLDMPDLDALPASPAAAPKASAPAGDDDMFAALLDDDVPAKKAAPPAENPGKTAVASDEDDLFADLDLALGGGDEANADSDGLDLVLSQPASDASGGSPDDDLDLLGDLALSPPEPDDNAPTAGSGGNLDDLNLDDLGLEDDTPAPAPKTPKAKTAAKASAPPKTAPRDELDIDALDDDATGIDDLNLDTLGLEEPDFSAVDSDFQESELAGSDADEQDMAVSALEDNGDALLRTNGTDIDISGLEKDSALDLGLEEPSAPDIPDSGALALEETDGLDLEDRDPALPGEAEESTGLGAAASEQAVEQAPPSASGTQGSRFEEVDLNELDALLDDMLATAPASGPAPAAAVPPAAQELPEAPEAVAPPEPESPSLQKQSGLEEFRAQLTEQSAILEDQAAKVRTLQESFAALSSDTNEQRERFSGYDSAIQGLEQRFSGYDDRISALETAAETSSPDEIPQKGAEDTLAVYNNEVQELVQRFSDASDRIQGMELRLAENNTEVQELIQRFSDSRNQMRALEQRLDSLEANAPGSPADQENPRLELLAGKVELLELELAEQTTKSQALEAQLAELLANMDKLAAETAAKVIREELAALMQTMS